MQLDLSKNRLASQTARCAGRGAQGGGRGARRGEPSVSVVSVDNGGLSK